MANEKTPVVWDDAANKHRPLGTGEKMGGLDASSLLSSDSGNLLEAGSDGLAYLSGSGMVDPRADNLLEESDRGKLQVTVDRIAEWLDGHPDAAGTLAAVLADGETIVASGGRLVVDPSTAPKAKLQKISAALAKAGAGLAVDSGTGKLVVDFASMDPAIMRSVVLSMVQEGGGIGVDSNGQLYVDFANMPTDKFEEMLTSLKMQVPLSAPLDVYVDASAGSDDVQSDPWGTQEHPFRTMPACVNYVTQRYALGRYSIDIHVGPGVYSHQMAYPVYTRTTGVINVRGSNPANRPVFANSSPYGTCCAVQGGVWNFYDVNFVCSFSTVQGDGIPRVPTIFTVSGGSVRIYGGCSFTASYSGPAAAQNFSIFLFSVTGSGEIYFSPLENRVLSLEYHKNSATSLEVFHLSRGGTIYFNSANFAPSQLNEYAFTATGEASFFCNANIDASFSVVQGNLHNPRIVVPTGFAATGGTHNVGGGSGVLAPYGGFPGDADSGVVDATTYSWYKEAAS